MKSRIPRFVNRRDQRGAGLIDLALWLIVIGGIAAFIFYINGVVGNRKATTDEAQNLNMMMSDIRAKFAAQGSFNGINPQVLIQLGVVPKSMINGSAIQSKWNTPITVQAVTLYGSAGDGVELTYSLPRANCADFVSAGEGAAARVTVGGTAVKNIPAGVNTIQQATVAAQCASDQGGNVTVAFAQGR